MVVKYTSQIGVQMAQPNQTVMIEYQHPDSEPIPPLTAMQIVIIVLKVIGKIILTLTGIITIVGLGLFVGGWMAGSVTDPTSRTLLAIGIGYICAQLIGILWMVIWMR